MSFEFTKTKKSKPQQTQAPVNPSTGKPSWMTGGEAAKKALAAEQVGADKRREDSKRMFTFYLKGGEDGFITFLDGDLIAGGDEDGMLDCDIVKLHTVRYRDRWTDFVCIADEEVCPLCVEGNDPVLVGCFTVLDHRAIKGVKNPDKVYQNEKKLFLAKRITLQRLIKIANRDTVQGLTGWTVEVSRSDAKVAKVGDDFDFRVRHTIAEVATAYPEAEVDVPTDYIKELPHYSAETLRGMGIGANTAPPTSESEIVPDSDSDSGTVPF